MTDKPMHEPAPTGRYNALADMPPGAPLSQAFRALDDADAVRRAGSDPDAGAIPPGFWDDAHVEDAAPEAELQEWVTPRLDADVLRHFTGMGKDYRSRINAVLRSYVRAQWKVRRPLTPAASPGPPPRQTRSPAGSRA